MNMKASTWNITTNKIRHKNKNENNDCLWRSRVIRVGHRQASSGACVVGRVGGAGAIGGRSTGCQEATGAGARRASTLIVSGGGAGDAAAVGMRSQQTVSQLQPLQQQPQQQQQHHQQYSQQQQQHSIVLQHQLQSMQFTQVCLCVMWKKCSVFFFHERFSDIIYHAFSFSFNLKMIFFIIYHKSYIK